MIRIDDVTWAYPHAESPCIDGLTLHVEPGECVVLCGASGSGKSTALRLMNGLIPHFHDGGVLTGEVTVDGLIVGHAELDEIGLRTGSVLQHPRRQFFADSATEEIAFAMENFGVEPARIRERVGAAVTELATAMPVDERLQRLSGGQQQQVAIAAASAHAPRILLLDEPSANLSAEAVERLAAALAAQRALGTTIVVAEHRLRYLQGLADRIIVMRDGRIDRVWSAEAFRLVPDDELAREGLRGEVAAVQLPAIPASGPSVAPRVDAAEPPATSSGGLTLAGVRCRFGGRTVLEIDRAEFAAGRVTALRGANGAGKSTLARVLTGLERASGSIRLDGRVVKRRQRQRLSAVVMQDVQRQLFTDSVAAEIDLVGGPERAASSDSASSREVLAALDLAHLASRHPLSLSGGQQQRLVVAAVRLAGQRIVVFDEPSSGVDRRHLRSIADQIRRVAADGAVVILVSHDEDLLALAADAELALLPLGHRKDAA